MRVPSVLIILTLTVFPAADLLDFSSITVWTDDDVTKSYVQRIPIIQSFFVFDAMISTQRSSNPFFSFEYEVEFDINQQPARNITTLCGIANGNGKGWRLYNLPSRPTRCNKPTDSDLAGEEFDQLLCLSGRHYLWWFKTL